MRSPLEEADDERMPQSREWRDYHHGVHQCDTSPLPAAPASNTNPPNSPTSALTGVGLELHNHIPDIKQASTSSTGPKSRKSKNDNRYLGVRVRMPVKDMLRNFRIAKGMDPKELQEDSKGTKGKKRVNTSADRRNRLKKWQTKSLEELAIIVEVLEEDLKTSTSPRPANMHQSSTQSPEPGDKNWCEHKTQQSFTFDSPPNRSFCETNTFLMRSVELYNSFPSSAYNQTITPNSQEGYDHYESVYYRPKSQAGMICSPGEGEYQVPSPQEASWCGSTREMSGPAYPYSVQEDWGSLAFFWTQMKREEHLQSSIPDQELLALDKCGRTLLHRAVDEGKRALVYVIARRMAELKKLDVKDTEGKTPLHLAAHRNQHLVVADLISLGANINEKDRYGKTCLHISAEYGYVRVLEVLKSCMRNGIYIDLEARDMNGLSALQHASVTLKSTVCELERSVTADQTRLHSLRKEQMMETLECLLQMECSLQVM
uniref:Zgc:113279 n=1 Tax=Astyanax mexicanus TaxID=7994 RepID=A0A8B9HV56_ASTMX